MTLFGVISLCHTGGLSVSKYDTVSNSCTNIFFTNGMLWKINVVMWGVDLPFFLIACNGEAGLWKPERVRLDLLLDELDCSLLQLFPLLGPVSENGLDFLTEKASLFKVLV